MIETRTAQIAVVEGVVVVHIREGVEQSVSDAEENLAVCVSLSAGEPRPLLIDIRRSRPLSAEVRHRYRGARLERAFRAVALLVEASPLGRMMGNVYLRVARFSIPTRLFLDEPSALAWLQSAP